MTSGVLVIGLTLLIAVKAERGVFRECPKVDTDESVQIAHDFDCTKYYSCVGGEKIERQCPVMNDRGERLHFNPELGLCDWPFNVNCTLPLPIMRMEEAAPKVTIPTKCPRVDSMNETVHLAHEYDCTKFYKCSYGVKHLMECPLDKNGNRLYFNPSAQVCDWPFNVNCTLPLPIMRMEEAAPKVTIPTKCPRVDSMYETVHLAHENDCTKFYKCSYGEKYLMQCPLDKNGNRLYFNASAQVCDWPFNVDCKLPYPSKKILLSASELRYPTECPKIDSPDESIQLPHEKDCTKFYMCSGGKKHLMVCPVFNEAGDRLFFNPNTHGCDWPQNVDCKLSQRRVLPIVLSVRKPVPTECPKQESPDFTVHLPHETDCTKFYKCSFGQKYLMSCPLTDRGFRLHYNRTEQVCDWPWNVDCDPLPDEPTTPSTPPTTPSTPPTTPSTPPTTPSTPPTTPSTPPTTPSTPPTTPSTPPTTPSTPPTTPSTPPTTPSTPPTTPSTPPTTPPTTTPSTPNTPPSTTPGPSPGVEGCIGTCPVNDPPNKITPLPHLDCRKWCRCANKIPKVFTCPADFHFSPTLKICTKPEEAGCEKLKYLEKSQASNPHDEALMNILGYNEQFLI